MRQRKTGLLCFYFALGLAVSPFPLLARTAEGAYVTLGTGNTSCGSFVSSHDAAYNPAMEGRLYNRLVWVLGFLSGYNVYNLEGISNIAPTDTDGIKQWILNYCREHPTESLARASIAFVEGHKAASKR
jgi:hypothetical protein